jgi:methionine-rich copper-binding protein CopC
MFSPSFSLRPRAGVFAAGMALSLALGAALVGSVIGASGASAHAALVKIVPAANARLSTAPADVVLEFDEPVSTEFVTVVVTSAAGVTVARGKPTVKGVQVTQPLSANIASGSYRIAYRVTSDDGHPVAGQSTFMLTLASGSSTATSTLSSPASPARATAPVLASTSGKTSVGLSGALSHFSVPVVGAAALLLMGVGLVLWRRGGVPRS